MGVALRTGVYKRAADVSKSHLSGASFRKHVQWYAQDMQAVGFLENRNSAEKIERETQLVVHHIYL